MALIDTKILETERNSVYVKSVAGERLTGTVQQNKDVFDKFPQLNMGKHNDLVDLLISIGIDNLESNLSNRYTKTEADSKITEETNDLVASVTIDTDTGVITVTKKDGTTVSTDTALEKVPAKFEFIEDKDNDKYYLKITNLDGTTSQTEVTNLMNQFTFTPSDTITFTQSQSGTTTTVIATVKAGSIGFNELKSEVQTYIDDKVADTQADKEIVLSAKTEVLNASQAVTENTTIVLNAKDDALEYANKAKSYAVGGTGTRTGEDTDNAQYYSEQTNLRANDALASANSAEASAESALDDANTASDKAKVAQDSANESKSYAVGGTGTRTGEDTDNAKYYKEQAEGSETNAAESAQTATQKAATATEKATEASSSAAAAQSSAASANQSKEQASSSASSAAASAKAAEEAKEQAEAIVGGDFATRATPAKVGNLAALTAEGNLSDSGKTADELDNIFIATYGTTTNEQMEQAYQAGKTLICKSGTYIGYLTVRSATQHVFMSFLGGGMIALFMCNSGSWIFGQLHIPTVAKSTTGNLAQLDADGNLVDSGVKASDKANKPTTALATMTASGWSSGEYSFESAYPFETYDIEIEPDSTITDEQLEAWSNAKIVGNRTSNKATAKGEVPTVNIPVIVKAVKK